MTHYGEADDADRVERAPALRSLGNGEMGVRVGYENVVDRVIDAARSAESHHVPVVDELCFSNRQHENARLTACFNDAESMDMSSVLDAGCKAPGSAQKKSAIPGNSLARARPLSGDDRKPVAGKQFADG